MHSFVFALLYYIKDFGTRVHGFKPGRSHQIFSDKKFLSMPSFGKEVKQFAPCRRFAAC
jgi:hypothetical protein